MWGLKYRIEGVEKLLYWDRGARSGYTGLDAKRTSYTETERPPGVVILVKKSLKGKGLVKVDQDGS